MLFEFPGAFDQLGSTLLPWTDAIMSTSTYTYYAEGRFNSTCSLYYINSLIFTQRPF